MACADSEINTDTNFNIMKANKSYLKSAVEKECFRNGLLSDTIDPDPLDWETYCAAEEKRKRRQRKF